MAIKLINTIIAMIIFSSCVKEEPLTELDWSTVLSTDKIEVTQDIYEKNKLLFSKVEGILAAKCLSCHNSGSMDLSFSDQKSFITKGLIVPGRLDQSKLYYRLKSASLNKGNENMPIGLTTMSQEEMNLISRWIVALSEGSDVGAPEQINAKLSTSVMDQKLEEGMESFSIFIELEKPTPIDIKLPIQISGEVIVGLDLTVADNFLFIPKGKARGELIFKVIEDKIVESLKTIVIAVANHSDDKLLIKLNQNQLNFSLLDNDKALQSFNAVISSNKSDSQFDESEGPIEFSIKLDKFAPFDLFVPISISGTAIKTFDYDTSSEVFTILKGTDSASFVINLIDDNNPEPYKNLNISFLKYYDENLNIEIMMSKQIFNYTLLDKDVADTTISYETFNASMSLDKMQTEISETDGPIRLTAVLDKNATKVLKIPVGITGEVVANNDYTLSKNFIEIPVGSKTGFLDINLVNDDTVEVNKSLVVNILSVTDSTNAIKIVPSIDKFTKILTSEDLPTKYYTGSVTLSDADLYVKENEGPLILSVALDGALLEPVSFNIGISGTVNSATDYILSSSVLTIPAGQLSGTVSLTLVNDSVEEADETLIINLVDYVNSEKKIAVNLDKKILNIRIDDDDVPVLPINFASVQKILVSKCTYCHNHGPSGDLPIDVSSEANLLKNSFVVAGSANSSKLYFKLKNAGVVSSSLETMPKNDLSLSDQYLSVIKGWIDSKVDSTQDQLSCDSEANKHSLEYKMRRLTNLEIKNTLKATLGEDIYGAISSYLISLPNDPFIYKENFQPTFLYGQLEAMNVIASQIALEIKKSDLFFGKIAGACALVAPMNNFCFENFIQIMAKKLYRRPIEQVEYEDLRTLTLQGSVYAVDPKIHVKNQFMVALMSMLQSPNFLLMVDRENYGNSLPINPFTEMGLSLDKLIIAHTDEYIYDGVSGLSPVEYQNVNFPENAISILTSFTPTKLSYGNGSSPQFRIVSQTTGSGTEDHIFMIGTDNDGTGKGGKIRIRLRTCNSGGSGCSTATLVSVNSYLVEGQKSKIALVYDGNSLNIFHNNTPVSMIGTLSSTHLASNASKGTYIGAGSSSYMPFIGTIHNAIILNRGVSSGELSNYFEASFDNGLSLALNTGRAPASIEYKSAESTDSEIYLKRTQFEIAAFLSYTLTSSPPDDLLYQAAKNGLLSSEIELKNHALRLIRSPLGKLNIKSFFSNWLELPGITSSPYSAEYLSGINPDGLQEEAVAQVSEHGMKLVVEDNASFKDLMGGTSIHINSQRIASLYGLGSFNENSTTSVPSLRAGILATPGLNISGGYFGSLVKRGVRVRRRVLCDNLLNPTAGDIEERDHLEPDRYTFSNREYWRLFTETNPTCNSCHAITNPLGNIFEGIDSMGRTRNSELLFSEDGASTGIEFSSINTTSTPYITELDIAEVNGPGEFGALLGESEKARSCFAEQVFQFSYKKHYEPNKDSCFVKNLKDKLGDGSKSMIDLFVDVVATKFSLAKTKK